ncbi:MAG: hypothetical protein QXW18_05870 [Candidatus Bathyarchaeia archaeon]
MSALLMIIRFSLLYSSDSIVQLNPGCSQPLILTVVICLLSFKYNVDIDSPVMRIYESITYRIQVKIINENVNGNVCPVYPINDLVFAVTFGGKSKRRESGHSVLVVG